MRRVILCRLAWMAPTVAVELAQSPSNYSWCGPSPQGPSEPFLSAKAPFSGSARSGCTVGIDNDLVATCFCFKGDAGGYFGDLPAHPVRVDIRAASGIPSETQALGSLCD
jgi:hypothetical protein